MGKPKSGYKRRPYNPPEGVTIPIRTVEAYALLEAVAKGSGCTIGKWAESALKYALFGEPYIPAMKPPAAATPLPRPRSFKISEGLLDRIMAEKGRTETSKWIAKTLLYLARIEMERLRGAEMEPDRFK